jgi:formate dehydrogenase maturation protein FdhE
MSVSVSPWLGRSERAEELRERHPFAAEVLTLYLAVLPVQEEAWSAARERPPHPEALAEWAAADVLPAVVEATLAAGPSALSEAVHDRDVGADALAGWLADDELDPVDRYLARASLAPALEALGEAAGVACAPARDGARLCPHCGGRPQLACAEASGEALVSGRRSLLCARCAARWSSSRSVCPACGEADEAKLMVYAEHWGDGNGAASAVFGNLRIAGCTTCRRYLIEVDLERDPRAVPEVDELAALPLDLYAADQGLTKLTTNLMGF